MMPNPQHQVQDHLGLGRLGAGLVAAGAAVALPSDQPPMPPEQRVGAEDGAQLAQGITAQLHRGAIHAVLLGQVQDDSSMAKLFPENPVLDPEIAYRILCCRFIQPAMATMKKVHVFQVMGEDGSGGR
jgi:hypothetical protein